MFRGCSSLTSLDLSGLDTSGIVGMSFMFSGCDALRGVSLGERFFFEGAGSSRICSLPEPSGDGLTGRWVSSVDGAAYAPSEVPSGVAATCTAQTSGADSMDPVDPDPAVIRIAGDYANQTSTMMSSGTFASEGCDAVVLARDDDFRDAMSAAGLAGALECPILLTSRDGLSESAASEIARLGAESAYIIGGPGAMPGDFESELAGLGVGSVERVYGNQSYDTSVECARMIAGLNEELEEGLASASWWMKREYWGDLGSAPVIVAYGQNFQDALSMSSFAYRYRAPILLQTFGDTAAERGLTEEAVDLVSSSFAEARIYVAGGEGAVSSASLEAVGFDEASGDVRLWGEDGYDTSLAIAEYMVENGFLYARGIVMASGALQAKGLDALAGAALAGQYEIPVLLANGQAAFGSVDMSAVEGFLAEYDVSAAYVLGGSYVLPDESIVSVLKPWKVLSWTYESEGFLYEVESGRASVMGYRRAAASLEIPSTIDGYPVAFIGDGAFSQCCSLESVVIPSSVVSVGNGAFAGCSSLTSVVIPPSVVSIGYDAFWSLADPSVIYVSTQEQYDLLNGDNYIFADGTTVALVA